MRFLQTTYFAMCCAVSTIAIALPAQGQTAPAELYRLVGVVGSATVALKAAPSESAADVSQLVFDSRAMRATGNRTTEWVELTVGAADNAQTGWLPNSVLAADDDEAPTVYRVLKTTGYGATVRTDTGMYVTMVRGGTSNILATGSCQQGVCPIRLLKDDGTMVGGWLLAKDLVVDASQTVTNKSQEAIAARVQLEAKLDQGPAADEAISRPQTSASTDSDEEDELRLQRQVKERRSAKSEEAADRKRARAREAVEAERRSAKAEEAADRKRTRAREAAEAERRLAKADEAADRKRARAREADEAERRLARLEDQREKAKKAAKLDGTSSSKTAKSRNTDESPRKAKKSRDTEIAAKSSAGDKKESRATKKTPKKPPTRVAKRDTGDDVPRKRSRPSGSSDDGGAVVGKVLLGVLLPLALGN
jgi:hypothetical protein